MARKTFSVQEVTRQANSYLANPELSPEFKMGVARLVENILHNADQYRGFTYNNMEIHPVENREEWTPEMEANRFYFC